MKIYITKLSGSPKDALAKRQERFAAAGRALGFLELEGTPEAEDVVFVQLPTGKGCDYEEQLIDQIKVGKDIKLVLVLHDTLLSQEELQSRYLPLYKKADALVISSVSEAERLKAYGISNLLYADDALLSDPASPAITGGFRSLCQSDFYIKKVLMDAVDAAFVPAKALLQSEMKMPEDVIHIGFGIHDKTGNYCTWLGTAMQSILEHTDSRICFHILHDRTLSDANKKKCIHVAERAGSYIRFHLFDEADFLDFSEQVGGYTIGTMFRLMMPELLEELPKIIYLDADILVNRDIKELWDTDIQNYCLAAVPDYGVVNGMVRPIPVKRNEVAADRYFNAGVIYMNLDRIREKGNMKAAVLDYLRRTRETNLPDQDALNAIYTNETLLLEASWNDFARYVRSRGEKQLAKKIYHYVGTVCILYHLTEMDFLYFETTGRTPWGPEECRKILNGSMCRISDRVNLLEKLVPQISVPGKKRIFYGEENFAMKNLYQLLTIHEGDYRVLAEPVAEDNCMLPCRELSVLAQEEKDSFIVFVLPQSDGGSSMRRLEEMGLQNEKDFFVIPRVLSNVHGGYVI